MRRAAGLLAALWALGLSAPAAAEPQRYRLDPQRSFVHFEVLHFGTSTIHGRIGPIEGEVVLDRAAGTGEIGLRIATATVSTGFKFFDSRLRQPDLLASDEFPEAFFVASRFHFGTGAGQPALAEVRGEFTLRGRGVPLSLHALRFGCRPAGAALPVASPQGSAPPAPVLAQAEAATPAPEVCGGDFEGEVLRSDFGATFGLPLVGDRVRLRVQVEGQRL
jgi:polyisoprenoid-binding protein YceI